MRSPAVALLVALLAAPLARAATVEVRVVHRDTGKAIEVPVQLLGLTPGGETLAREGRTDGRGTARFADLPIPGAYLLMAQYAGVGFHADSLRFDRDATADAQRSATIEVHEPVQDTSGVSVSAVRVFLDQEAEVYRLDQVVVIDNAGESVVKPAEGAEPIVRVALAPGHRELRTPMGALPAGFTRVDDVLELHGAVFPGTREVVLSYDLESPAGRLDTELTLPSRTPTFELYVADRGVMIDAGVLYPARPARDDEGQTFQRYVGFDLPAGTRLPLSIQPLPPRGSERPALTAGLAALLGAALIFFVGRPVTREAHAPAETGGADPEELEKQALYSALRDLEHDFDTGKLSEEDRDRLRAELRRDALVALARRRGSGVRAAAPELPAPHCGECGRAAGPEDAFCATCGAKL